MKVKLLTSRAGVGFVQNCGDVIDVDAAEAKRMMESSPPQCVPVREADDIERAVERPAKSKRKARDTE